ncbi:MAG: S8 family serine peptidase, partial [Cyclobacteriaceae bacterium]
MPKYLYHILLLLLSILISGGNLLAQRIEKTPAFDRSQFIVKFSSTGESRFLRSAGPSLFGDLAIKEVVPLLNPLQRRKSNHPTHLDGIYKVQLDRPVKNLKEIINEINRQPGVIYAEPAYYDKPLLTTNDPFANPSTGSQYYLSLINAYDAWEVTTGTENIRIAILDSGIDPDHEDVGNIFINEADPINGIDDDGNGFIDDYMGWDFANSDNDPSADQNDHGMRVTGVSSAGTDNGLGMAGVGFNTSVVPIKIFTSETGVSSNAYEAIIYAADQGYEVINLSWGSPGSFSQYRQDIINYATLEKGAVIVAAAGNTPENLDFYPASYDHVLSVAATNENDQKAEFSTFSHKVDLSAPGDNILTTANGNGYSTSSGTSFASPQVAAAAALLISEKPDWTNLQVMEHLRVTTDNIDLIGGNENFKNMLGSGRLNVAKSLSTDSSRSVRIDEYSYSNGVGEYAYFGDTVTFDLKLTNYLSSVENLQLRISIDNPAVTVIEPLLTVGNFDSLAMQNASFAVVLADSIANDQLLTFRIDYSGVAYRDVQFITIKTSTDRLDFGVGDSYLTSNSLVEFGHEQNTITEGIGFRWQGKRLLENMGLLIGNSPASLADNAFINTENLIRSEDFSVRERLKIYPHPVADLHAAGVVETTDKSNIGLQIDHKYYAWENSIETSNIILEFRISNASQTDYDSLYVGLLANWDVNTAVRNSAFWNASDSIAITMDENVSILTGMAVLSENVSVNYNHLDLSELSMTEQTNISDGDKYDQLSSFRTDSLVKTDIAQTLSILLPELKAGKSMEVAFVLSAASGPESLKAQIQAAKTSYQAIRQSPRVASFSSTCQGGDITLFTPETDRYSFFRDPFGEDLIKSDSSLRLSGLQKDTTIYYQKYAPDGLLEDLLAYRVRTIPTIASFTMSTDTVYIGESGRVNFTNTSEFTATTSWDLGNGLFTTLANPTANYVREGQYQITLEVESIFGCKDIKTQTIVVLSRSAKPEVPNSFNICAGQSVSIMADNTSSIRVYGDSELQNPLFNGEVFTTENLEAGLQYFVTNTSGDIESLPVKVDIKVNNPIANIIAVPDTVSLTELGIRLKADPVMNPVVSKWSVNGNDKGADQEIALKIEEFVNDSLKVMMQINDDLGCTGEASKVFTLSKAGKPFFPNQSVCRGSDLEIVPENGKYFAFYDKSDADKPMKKGSQLMLNNLLSDTTIFISNIDGFLESERQQLELTVDDFEIKINPVPSIVIDESRQAK